MPVTEREKKLLELYRELSDENKTTIDILTERLMLHEQQEENNAKSCNM